MKGKTGEYDRDGFTEPDDSINDYGTDILPSFSMNLMKGDITSLLISTNNEFES